MDKEGVGADWRRIDDSPCYLVRSYEAVGADPIVGCVWQEAGAPFGWSRWLACGCRAARRVATDVSLSCRW